MRAALGARIALVVGLMGMAMALGVVLSSSPLTVAGTNHIPSDVKVAATRSGNITACQGGELLPAGTIAIRLALETVIGPPVAVAAFTGDRIVAQGRTGAGWPAGAVTVPVNTIPRTIPAATVCWSLGRPYARVAVIGKKTPPQVAAVANGRPLPGRLRIEYLKPGHLSWLALASSGAWHMGLGHAIGGAWVPLLVAALAVAVVSLVALALWGGRAGAWTCVLVACLNAACWSLITPPFQVPDEPAHLAYVQSLTETWQLPSSAGERYSPQEETARADLSSSQIDLQPEVRSLSTEAAQRRLEHDLSLSLSKRGGREAGVAASEPPLYYALETIPYGLASAGTLLDQLQAMRLLSVLIGGLTALFAYLFVRETLPSMRWVWPIGGLSVALSPLLAEMSGGVNPDALLYAVSAALFYCLARAFRRGLSPRMATAIGVVIAVGLLTKVNFVGLVPGALLALVILAVRARRAGEHRAYRMLARCLAIVTCSLVAYAIVDLLTNHVHMGLAASTASADTQSGWSLPGAVSYVWQLYLPALPGMHVDFPDVTTMRQVWFRGYVGLFGWVDTTFPAWVYDVALVPAGALAILCLRELFRGRAKIMSHVSELAVYAALGLGLMTLVAVASYTSFVHEGGATFEPRYLLPLIPLLGVAFALAARGAGRRWGPAVGALLVILLLAHDVFGQLQTIARYYG